MNVSNTAARIGRNTFKRNWPHLDLSPLVVALNRVLLGGLPFVFLALPAQADSCPGSDTCPVSPTANAQGPNAAELKWIEPDQLPIYYYATSNPPAPNQPVQYQVIDPIDPEDRMIFGLTPSTAYTFTICGVYSSSNQSCVTTTSVVTGPPQTGVSTPTPTITKASATTNSIIIWWDGNRSYDSYHTRLEQGQPPQSGDFGGGATGSYQFGPPEFPLQPGMVYLVEVQGCLNGGWISICSQWATANVMTESPPPPPPPPALAPQNLHTANGPSDIAVLWTNPPGVESFNIFRGPGWAPGSQYKDISGGIDDLSAVGGQLYTYKVCLNYQSGTACAYTTGALPPKCTIAFSCPIQSYVPPDYLVQCDSRADFYLNDTRTFMGTDTKLSGESDAYPDAIMACASGTQAAQSCSSYSIQKLGVDWCGEPPPPPPPAPRNCCLACVQAGGSCNRGPHGCTCF